MYRVLGFLRFRAILGCEVLYRLSVRLWPPCAVRFYTGHTVEISVDAHHSVRIRLRLARLGQPEVNHPTVR